MDNVAFMSAFPTSYAQFLPFMTSDHSLAVFAIPEVDKVKPKPFKFHNYLTSKGEFIPTVKEIWSSDVERYSLFSLVSKLKMLKKLLRKLNFDQGNLFDNVEKLGRDLASIQASLVSNPISNDLREAKLALLKAYKVALKDEELFLRQKAKIIWLSEGDRNSKYFHNVVKGRVNRGRISVVEDLCGIPHFGLSVDDQFLAKGDANFMVREVSNDEVKAALFDIDSNKPHGSDGYSSYFFKSSWDVIGKDFCMAVKEFFSSRKLLKEVNSTVISLVPKLPTPRNVLDYRPIACCNVVYKCISKIMVNRIKGCMDILVDKNQSAFIPYRQISDNVLLSQELLRGYHRKRGHASKSVSILKNALDEFGRVSGLFLSFPKSTIFFRNVKESSKAKILNNNSLSFAGRLRLIMSVVGSMQVYRSSMFILLVTISNEVERLMRDFLWNYGEFKRGKSRIKWSNVCKPKIEGGLGIKSLEM
ncbi:putative reverse transcriptase domain-containing protein [Tanacetum coccineum]